MLNKDLLNEKNARLRLHKELQEMKAKVKAYDAIKSGYQNSFIRRMMINYLLRY